MPERLPDINLLPEVRQESRTQSILFMLFLGLIILSLIVMAYLYLTTNSKLKDARAQAESLSEQKDELAIEKASLETDEQAAYEQAVSFAEHYALPTSLIVEEVNRLLPEDSYLKEYEYAYQDIGLKAHFESLDKVANYTTELLQVDYFKDLTVDSVERFSLKEEDGEDGEILFDVIPRYEGDFTLILHKEKVKEESRQHE